MSSGLTGLLEGKRIVVNLGAGGVGKTTLAISIAVLAAMEGRRVALLSIDPAKRLAAALGISLGNQLSEIDFPPSMSVKGSVFAAMLDQKSVFDGMVHKHSPSKAITARILEHPLYKAASTNLSGPLEYMALAKLQELAEDSFYDFVVLDTPPDTHALDFLARPNVLAGFMENKVMTWMIKPFLLASRLGLGKVMSAGEKLMGGVASVTGFTALRSLSEFLVLMQEVIEGFHSSGEKILGILRRPTTAFFLVTVPTFSASRSATNIASQLSGMGYDCNLLLFNRCLPDAVARDLKSISQANALPESCAALNERLNGEFEVKDKLSTSLRRLNRITVPTLEIPDQDFDLHNLEAVYRMAGEIRGLEFSGKTGD